MKLADARTRAEALTAQYGIPYVVLVDESSHHILVRPCSTEPPPAGYVYHYSTDKVSHGDG